ncbi:MAG: hypothetical protein ACKVU0_20680 [Saprospiraceae bacterium]
MHYFVKTMHYSCIAMPALKNNERNLECNKLKINYFRKSLGGNPNSWENAREK